MIIGSKVDDSLAGVEIVGYEGQGFARHFGGCMLVDAGAASVSCSPPMDLGAVTMEGPGVYGG
jgi:hypothetical protein